MRTSKCVKEQLMSHRIKFTDEAPTALIDEPMPLDQSLRWISSSEHQLKPHVEIFFAQSAYVKCSEHAASDLNSEVGGLLIGETRTDSSRIQTYILIQDIIPAQFTDSSGTHVTFTQNSLVHLNRQLEEQFPGKQCVGWYHTHPGLGVFLSGHDVWLHQHFFGAPAQVALVVDPESDQAGFFCWQDGSVLDPTHYAGFYEWSDLDDSSVIEWTSLSPVVPGVQVQEGELK
jgi:proteasome lid subunit RPN8/RPN11